MDTEILLYTLVPVAAARISGGVAAVRLPSPLVQSGIQHFAAGVIVAAAAIELLPDLVRSSPAPTLIGFSVGLVVMFALRWWSERRERRADGGDAGGLLLASGLDFLVDGLVMGAGFAAGRRTGVLLTLAVAIEYLFVGLSVSSALGAHARRLKRVAMPLGLSVLTVIGAVVGASVLSTVPHVVLVTTLAFGAVAFMYLVTEELLVRAHEQGHSSLAAALFFVGFLAFLLIAEVSS